MEFDYKKCSNFVEAALFGGDKKNPPIWGSAEQRKFTLTHLRQVALGLM